MRMINTCIPPYDILKGDPQELRKSIGLLHRPGCIPGTTIRGGKFTDARTFWYSKVTINTNDFLNLASISLKSLNIWKIHTKSFEILCTKSMLLSFVVILSLGLKIEHSYWNCTELFLTPNQQEKSNFSKLFWHGLLESYNKFSTIPIRMFNLNS